MEKEKEKKKTAKGGIKEEVTQGEKPKSKISLFWEKNPDGIGGEIVNMRAVLR